MTERFMAETVTVVEGAVSEPWEVTSTDWEIFITSPDWKCTRGRGKGDAWLELSDIVQDENDHSWIAVAVGAGPTQLCLELKLRNGLLPIDACLKARQQLSTTLKGKGFELRDEGTRLLMPIKIEGEALAIAFESGDFAKCLAPVRTASRSAAEVKQELDDLVGFSRAKARPS